MLPCYDSNKRLYLPGLTLTLTSGGKREYLVGPAVGCASWRRTVADNLVYLYCRSYRQQTKGTPTPNDLYFESKRSVGKRHVAAAVSVLARVPALQAGLCVQHVVPSRCASELLTDERGSIRACPSSSNPRRHRAGERRRTMVVPCRG